MEPDFWLERWSEGRIGFHLPRVNPHLERHHDVLSPRCRVLVPLAGKTLDLWWLREQGHEVTAVELLGDATRDTDVHDVGASSGGPRSDAGIDRLLRHAAANAAVAVEDLARLERAVDPLAPPTAAAAAAAFVARIEGLCGRVSAAAGLPVRLGQTGLDRERLPWLAANSGGASLRGNPRDLDPAALEAILAAAW